MYLHSAVDGHTRLAYTEPLPDEKASTAITFLHRARAWFAAHGITRIERLVTDNGACYRADAFTRALLGSRHPTVHAPAQWESGTVQPDPGRRVPVRTHLDLRKPARPGAGGVEHPLQLPPTPHRPRRTTTRDNTQADRHQRPGLIHPSRASWSPSPRSPTRCSRRCWPRPRPPAACPSSTGVFSEDQVSPGPRWPGGGAGPGSDCRCRTSRARRRPTGSPRHRPGPARRPRPGSPAARPGC